MAHGRGSLTPSHSSASLIDSNALLMKVPPSLPSLSFSFPSLSDSLLPTLQVRIPELDVQRIAKLSWDMTVHEAISHICKRHRFENPEKYSLFLPYDETSMGDNEDEHILVSSKCILVRKVVEKSSKIKKKTVLVIEENQPGRWLELESEQELRAHPSMETAVLELRRKPEYLQILFQNGEWQAEIRHRDDMSLSFLLRLALQISTEIQSHEATAENEVYSL
jgi:hypothetical protein